ncbi:hypothetical protein C8J56DRAFT_959789 [Mycena floridula]|nr:hypothetical protein C8J56DRAFT_959789 [Mycena floridula]
MTSWTSWIPSLPSISIPFSLPSSIQRRFISFALKTYLGHFLKPGQLDVKQIDSQLGSGYVQVSDLELNNETINQLISGLPLQLESGTVASVTARIPWPNPLSSDVGLALDSLHLTLRISDKPLAPPVPPQNLADSVVSVAESFIHDEMTPQEMLDSFHPDLVAADDQNLPGGLDPFITAPEEEDFGSDVDPAGVPMFAALIERLLARVKFDAVNTKITLIHPQHSMLSVTIAQIHYLTEESPLESEGGEVRTVSVSGITVATKRLGSSPSSSRVRAESRPSSSPASSSSSLDEDTHWAMSQSLAFLPPRASSPASSVASSMYQSAISGIAEEEEEEPSSPDLEQPPPASPAESVRPSQEETILFFGTEPISIQLSTPSVHSPSGESPGPSQHRRSRLEKLQLSVSAGIVACALNPGHIRAVSDIANAFTSGQSPQQPPMSESSSGSMGPGIDGVVKLKGLVLLVLPSFKTIEEAEFFSKPLVPPRLSHGYLRLHLDSINGSISSTSEPPAPRSSSGSILSLTSTLSIAELSLFAVSASTDETKVELSAYPLLITDQHLPSQYSSTHIHPNPASTLSELPVFEVMDWTDSKSQPNGLKISTWRTRAKGKHTSRATSSVSPDSASGAIDKHQISAVTVSFKRTSSRRTLSDDLEISIVPLHIFLDVDMILSNGALMAFLDELSASSSSSLDLGDADDTPPATPRATVSLTEREKERRRLEQLVLEDLDLSLNYPVKRVDDRPQSSIRKASTKRQPKKTDNKMNLALRIPMIRVQVRCPPLLGRAQRSGALVLDLHNIEILNNPPRPAPQIRFSEDVRATLDENALMIVECSRMVLAYAPVGQNKAFSVLSLGSLSLEDLDTGDVHFASPSSAQHAPLQPRITVTQPSLSSDSGPSALALSLMLPSVYVNLTKEVFDGLQYWADDLTQFIERTFSDSNSDKTESRDGSIIGSRYFAKSRSGSGNSSGITVHPGESKKNEIVVKVSNLEAFVRVMVPRTSEDPSSVRPFDICASDVDILVELKPQGKDETVITLGLMDLSIKNTASSAISETFLSLTTPRSLTSSPKTPLKLRFTSLVIPTTTVKESRVRLSLWGFTYNLTSEVDWISDLASFAKAPPGAFESVIPSERTVVSLKVLDCSVRAVAPVHPGAIILHLGELEFSTNLVGDSPDAQFNLSVPSLALLALDDLVETTQPTMPTPGGVTFWRKSGFVLVAELSELQLLFQKDITAESGIRVVIDGVALRLHLCADTVSSIAPFIDDLSSAFKPPSDTQAPRPAKGPTLISEPVSDSPLLSSVDDLAFKRVPDVGSAPDMIYDDLPTNLDYLDESFGAAAGLRELRDDDLEDFDLEEALPEPYVHTPGSPPPSGLVSKVGGETIKMLHPDGIKYVENYYDTLKPDSENNNSELGRTSFRFIIHKADINVLLYDGYDWTRTRKTIEEEVKEMRKRLAKIRQLVATGQTQDSSLEETSAVLFNSVYIGLDQDVDDFEPSALIAAIDEELKDDFETASQSSWQSLRPPTAPKPAFQATRPSIEFRLGGLEAEIDQYLPGEPMVSRTFATVKNLEILDRIKTSTWDKFLTDLRSDSRGDIRETDSNMVRVELRNIQPVAGHSAEEARLRAKILPLRLYVDQDALDFLKKFFSFKDPKAVVGAPSDPGSGDIYFQIAEVFPIDLKLDYKPRRVDYRALKEGKTIELMNFFHFDGAEMTLRHITLFGITGWPRLFDLLNDLWTPDVKATQLVDVISGVAPIRSVVNVGSGIADLVLLPIAQYKKDGRIVRGVQKGATAFVKSTAIEAIKLGARLATGTQVILEHAEGVLGSQFKDPVTAETLQIPFLSEEFGQGFESSDEEDEAGNLISKYAEQPEDLKEGMQTAYRALRKNFNSAAQTILAVPMEVYERSGNEGPVRSVIRAVPIAVLKPMIGASEAVSKTLFGLHNTLDPNVRHDNEAKYKHR